MEGVSRVTPMRYWVTERPDHLYELEDRARPTVNEQQRKGDGVGRTGMDEMDRLTIDFRPKLIEAVQDRFLGAPIERRPPVLTQLTQVGTTHPVGPVAVLIEVVDVARPVESLSKVDKRLVGNRQRERGADLHHDLLTRERPKVDRASTAFRSTPDRDLTAEHSRRVTTDLPIACRGPVS